MIVDVIPVPACKSIGYNCTRLFRNVKMLRALSECRWQDGVRRLLRYGLIVVACVAFGPAASAQQVFATPQAAADALVAALKSNERKNILGVVGWSAFDILSSGDDVADEVSRKRFIEDYAQNNQVVMQGDLEATLVTGGANSPFPIPLVRSPQGWQFDIATGRQELLRARIVRNEARAIEASREYVRAQRDFAAMTAAKEGTKRYAQRIVSRPGQKDGLYWPATNGEAPSPLHGLIERAKADGYSLAGARAPHHGYAFKVLFKQGPKAAGGSFDYNDNGKMVRGFALIAYPIQYGHSGVMTFMVNQSGVVFEKDLGASTTRFANREIWFNPDQTWRKAARDGGGK
jgi:hypothetical protein